MIYTPDLVYTHAAAYFNWQNNRIIQPIIVGITILILPHPILSV